MQQTLIAVDPDALKSILEEIRELRKIVTQAQISAPQEWLTIPEYAAHVGKSVRTITNWKKAGQIETKIEGKTTLVRVNQAA